MKSFGKVNLSLGLVASSAMAKDSLTNSEREMAKEKATTVKSEREPAQAGHENFICESQPLVLSKVSEFLNRECDPQKSFSVLKADDQHSSYTACCVARPR